VAQFDDKLLTALALHLLHLPHSLPCQNKTNRSRRDRHVAALTPNQIGQITQKLHTLSAAELQTVHDFV